MRCGARTVEVTEVAIEVEQRSCGLRVDLFHVFVFGVSTYEALHAGSRGDDGEPDHTFGCPLGLRLLHVARGVMLFSVWAALIVPLENNEFSAVVAEFHGLAVAVFGGEIRRGFADFRGVCSCE